MAWECGIEDCGATFEDAETAIAHQVQAHERHECGVCGTIVPDGYLAIRHVFSEHSRAEYVRAYGAGATAVRERESLLEDIDAEVDKQVLADALEK